MIIRQWQNVETSFYSESTGGSMLIISRFLIVGSSRWHMRSFDLMTAPSGHFEVILGQKCFSSNLWMNRDRDLGWSQCISLAEIHQLACNISYSGQHVTLRNLDLRSNFSYDVLRSICASFDAFRWEKIGGRSFFPGFLCSNVTRRKNDFAKRATVTFLDL